MVSVVLVVRAVQVLDARVCRYERYSKNNPRFSLPHISSITIDFI